MRWIWLNWWVCNKRCINLYEDFEYMSIVTSIINKILCNTRLYFCHLKIFCNAISSCKELFECFDASTHWNLKLHSILLFYVVQSFSWVVISCAMPSSQLQVTLVWMNSWFLQWPVCCVRHRWPLAATRVSKSGHKMIHMLCRTRPVATKSDIFFNCTSILFIRNRHRPFSMSNARSTNLRVGFCT